MPVTRQPNQPPSPTAPRPVYRTVPAVRPADAPGRPSPSGQDRADGREVPFWEPYVKDRLRHFADY